ncbi:NADH-quinone oxidoreductase subunit J [Nisaea sp.]|uniref:NADH-quinone oxidoreductase subunit J n=1 Tax=Nisaea sp. TaxID=2024842 RepID=UPI0032ECB627
MIQALIFYVFAAITIASGVMVVSSRNPVHSVLFLILAFFNAAGLFVLIGAEFIAMILVVVYVGAVAVLFLFVVMMLDINFVELRQGFMKYLPIGLLIGVVIFAELFFVVTGWVIAPDMITAAPAPDPSAVTNTHALGALIYTRYVYLFQSAGLILLIAMIGAIVLTLRKRPGVKRQRISEQLSRTTEETVEVVSVQRGEGV